MMQSLIEETAFLFVIVNCSIVCISKTHSVRFDLASITWYTSVATKLRLFSYCGHSFPCGWHKQTFNPSQTINSKKKWDERKHGMNNGKFISNSRKVIRNNYNDFMEFFLVAAFMWNTRSISGYSQSRFVCRYIFSFCRPIDSITFCSQ